MNVNLFKNERLIIKIEASKNWRGLSAWSVRNYLCRVEEPDANSQRDAAQQGAAADEPRLAYGQRERRSRAARG